MTTGIKRKAAGEAASTESKVANTFIDKNGKLLGKNYFRDSEVNKGFYSKKREGVADVDPKVCSFTVNTLRLWNPLYLFQESLLGK